MSSCWILARSSGFTRMEGLTTPPPPPSTEEVGGVVEAVGLGLTRPKPPPDPETEAVGVVVEAEEVTVVVDIGSTNSSLAFFSSAN